MAVAGAEHVEVLISVAERAAPTRVTYRRETGEARGKLQCLACGSWRKTLAWVAPGPWRCAGCLGLFVPRDLRLSFSGVLGRRGAGPLLRIVADQEETPARREAAAAVLASAATRRRRRVMVDADDD